MRLSERSSAAPAARAPWAARGAEARIKEGFQNRPSMTPEAPERSAQGRQGVTSKQFSTPTFTLWLPSRAGSLLTWENQAFMQPERLVKPDPGLVVVGCLGG